MNSKRFIPDYFFASLSYGGVCIAFGVEVALHGTHKNGENLQRSMDEWMIVWTGDDTQ